jgi:hypothetical protein
MVFTMEYHLWDAPAQALNGIIPDPPNIISKGLTYEPFN